MIDKNGKVGGKINLIDLLIVLVIIAAGIFVFLRTTRSGDGNEGAAPATMTFHVESTATHVVEQMEAGASVWDYSSNVTLGTLTDFDYYDFMNPIADGMGSYIAAPVEGSCQADLTVEVNGVIGTHGITIDGQLYGLGHTLVMYAGDCKVFASVSGIEAR